MSEYSYVKRDTPAVLKYITVRPNLTVTSHYSMSAKDRTLSDARLKQLIVERIPLSCHIEYRFN